MTGVAGNSTTAVCSNKLGTGFLLIRLIGLCSGLKLKIGGLSDAAVDGESMIGKSSVFLLLWSVVIRAGSSTALLTGVASASGEGREGACCRIGRVCKGSESVDAEVRAEDLRIVKVGALELSASAAARRCASISGSYVLAARRLGVEAEAWMRAGRECTFGPRTGGKAGSSIVESRASIVSLSLVAECRAGVVSVASSKGCS
jgi:hypothetical protein